MVLMGVHGWHSYKLEELGWRGRRVHQRIILLRRLDIQDDRRVAPFDQTIRVLMQQLNLRGAFQRPILVLFDPKEVILHGRTQPSISYLLVNHEREQLHKRNLLLE
jgi:hypothetical protein